MQMSAEASLLDYVTFIVASPFLMPKAWQKSHANERRSKLA